MKECVGSVVSWRRCINDTAETCFDGGVPQLSAVVVRVLSRKTGSFGGGFISKNDGIDPLYHCAKFQSCITK